MRTPFTRRQTALWTAVLLLLLAGAMRAYGVGRQALRGDEAFSVRFSAQPLGDILAAMGTAEPNPPLYWFLLHGWMQFVGTSELALRWPSVLAGVVAVAATYRLGTALAGRPTGALAALLAAVNPFLIWYAQDARVYSLLAALVTAATWLTWTAARRPATRRWLAAGGLWWLALFGHYFAVLPAAMVAASTLAGLRLPRRAQAATLLMFLGVGAAYLPWAVYVGPLLAGHHKAWIAPLDPLTVLWRSLAAAAAGTPGTGATPGLLQAGAAALGLMAAGAVLWTRRYRRLTRAWLLAVAFGPALLLWLISLVRPVYTEQYVFGSVPALLVLAAWGARRLGETWPRERWLSTTGMGALLLVGLLAASNAAFNPAFAKSPDWRGLNRYLADTARPGEVVVMNLPEPAFYYYYTASMPAVTSPPRPLEDESAVLETEAQLAALRAGYEHVRFIHQPASGYDPLGLVGQRLDECCEMTGQAFVFGWLVRTFDTPAGSLAAREPYGVEFENGLALTGYRVLDNTPHAGDTLHLTLYWTAHAPVAEAYTVFVHLLTPDGFEVGNADSQPDEGRRPTNQWAVGESVIDPHRMALEAELPAGEYGLEVGLYALETGERLGSSVGEALRLPVWVEVRGKR